MFLKITLVVHTLIFIGPLCCTTNNYESLLVS